MTAVLNALEFDGKQLTLKNEDIIHRNMYDLYWLQLQTNLCEETFFTYKISNSLILSRRAFLGLQIRSKKDNLKPKRFITLN